MSIVRLESIKPEANRYRYYTLWISPTLWHTWGLTCHQGRIGQESRDVRVREYASQNEALVEGAKVIDLRMKHGYRVKITSLSAWEQFSQSPGLGVEIQGRNDMPIDARFQSNQSTL